MYTFIFAGLPEYNSDGTFEARRVAILYNDAGNAPHPSEHLVTELETSPFAEIPAARLRERLPGTLRVAAARRLDGADGMTKEETKAYLARYTDFVEACEKAEAESGRPLVFVAGRSPEPLE